MTEVFFCQSITLLSTKVLNKDLCFINTSMTNLILIQKLYNVLCIYNSLITFGNPLECFRHTEPPLPTELPPVVL